MLLWLTCYLKWSPACKNSDEFFKALVLKSNSSVLSTKEGDSSQWKIIDSQIFSHSDCDRVIQNRWLFYRVSLELVLVLQTFRLKIFRSLHYVGGQSGLKFKISGLVMVAHVCKSSYSRGRGGRITVWDWPRRSMRPYLKMNENKNRWGHGPIGRVFA